MGESGVAQLGPLRRVFTQVYERVRPRRVAVLGCGPGEGLDAIETACTERLVAVDLNQEYISLARERHPRLSKIARWMCVPVERCVLEAASFDLVHAALLFEYVEPVEVLPRIARWLTPEGALSVVLQLPGGDGPVSDMGFSSLRSLSGVMRLVSPDRMCEVAAAAGLTLRWETQMPLKRGKRFWAGTFTLSSLPDRPTSRIDSV